MDLVFLQLLFLGRMSCFSSAVVCHMGSSRRLTSKLSCWSR